MHDLWTIYLLVNTGGSADLIKNWMCQISLFWQVLHKQQQRIFYLYNHIDSLRITISRWINSEWSVLESFFFKDSHNLVFRWTLWDSPHLSCLRESSILHKIPTWRAPIAVSQTFLEKVARSSVNQLVLSQSSISSMWWLDGEFLDNPEN